MTLTPTTLALLLLAAGTPTPAAPPRAPAPAAQTLSWMAGSWQGRDEDGTEEEETWLPPKGGALLGMHRDVRGGRAVSFEFFRIAEEPQGLVYWASPHGKPATPFTLAESGPKRAVFANPEHDFPKRVLYWLDEHDALHARIEGGPEQAMEWTWTRVKS